MHLFIAGTERPAGDNSYLRELVKLDDKSFMREFISCGNESLFQEAFQNEELIELFKDVIRVYFYVLASFYYLKKEKLSIPVTVINGTDDYTVSESDSRLWSNETTAITDYLYMPGDHFFIFGMTEELTGMVKKRLTG